MKISKETIAILKNFSIINNSMYFNEANILKTMSIAANITAIADIEETLPKFAIFELSKLLGAISLFDIDETEFEFTEKNLTIRSGKNATTYTFTPPDLMPISDTLKPSETYKKFNNFNAAFDLSEENLLKLQKASNIMNLDTIKVSMKDGAGELTLFDGAGSTRNTFTIEIDGSGDCTVSFRVENMTFIKNDYKVDILDKTMIKFSNQQQPILYFVSAKV